MRLGRTAGVGGVAGAGDDAGALDDAAEDEVDGVAARCTEGAERGGMLRDTATPGGVDGEADEVAPRLGAEERDGAPAPIGSIEDGGAVAWRAAVVLASGCEGGPERAAAVAPGGGATDVATAPGPASVRAPMSGRRVESGAITRGKRGRRKR